MGHFLTIFNTHIELWNYKKKCIKKECHTRQKNDITATVFVCAIICCYVWATVGDLLGDWIFNMTIIFYPTGLKYQTSFVVEMKDTWNGYRCCFILGNIKTPLLFYRFSPVLLRLPLFQAILFFFWLDLNYNKMLHEEVSHNSPRIYIQITFQMPIFSFQNKSFVCYQCQFKTFCI